MTFVYASNPVAVVITRPETLVDVGVLTLPQALKTVTGHVVYRDTGEAARNALVRAGRRLEVVTEF